MKAYPKMKHGRGGLPERIVRRIYADYRRGLSLELVGKRHGRTRQSIYDTFHNRGLLTRAKEFKPAFVHNGRKFTKDKQGYLRSTIFRRGKKLAGEEVYLHRIVWVEAHGPIRAGYDVTFKDGDRSNVKLSNLICAEHAVVSSMTATGHNGATKKARETMASALEQFNTRRAA
jgi:HNH endonuclease